MPPRWCRCEVYPRVCGGSDKRLQTLRNIRGLSPRVRGKRGAGTAGSPFSGSIPACAGEAERHNCVAGYAGVYPRVCGGSGVGPVLQRIEEGLSPRVRGKLAAVGRRICGARSIPACAGEAWAGMML